MKKLLIITLLFASCTRSVDSPNSIQDGTPYLKYHIGASANETVFTGNYISAMNTGEGVAWIKMIQGGAPDAPPFSYSISAVRIDNGISLYNTAGLTFYGDPAGAYPAYPQGAVFFINGKEYAAVDATYGNIQTTITKNSNGAMDGTFTGTLYPIEEITNEVPHNGLLVTGEFHNVKSQ